MGSLPYFLKRGLWLLLCFSGMATAMTANARSDTLDVSEENVYPVNQYLSWLQTEKEITPDSALRLFTTGKAQRLYPRKAIADAGTQNNYWMMLTLSNKSGTDRDLFFQFNNPYLNTVIVYKKPATALKR